MLFHREIASPQRAWLSGARVFFIGISTCVSFLISCGGLGFIVYPSPTPSPTWTAPPLPSETPHPTLTPILFPTHSPTTPPTETPPPTLTWTPTLTLEPQPVFQGPGEVVVPILLYHHIGFSLQEETVYYISPEAFDRQMNLLYHWGYETISVELLVRAIREGASLPPKPVILTFDDGSESTYATALPIMQRYGFTGAAYVVLNYVGIPRHMNVDQIRSLHASGWEIGSHSLSHRDLTLHPGRQENEIVESRRRLERLLGIPVLSFAYPFGAYDETSLQNVHSAGYIAAMGLGNETVQGSKNLFYLSRRPVRGTDDLRSFSLLLPWREEQYDLPPVTIVP
ncbi:MAG TPA: polysaccharide deacetylase family protein [Anaerolineales bacterium]|nr:polysaccharide deacetylase family protein [Anaerolineales bacterium]